MSKKTVSAQDLVKSHENVEYYPLETFPFADPSVDHNRPPFSFSRIHDMMRDPRLRFALGLIKGPIHSEVLFLTKKESEDEAVNQMVVQLDIDFPYVVDSGNDEMDGYIVSVLERFWMNGAMKALSAVEWGFSGMEVIYKTDHEGKLDYGDVRLIHQEDTRLCTRNGRITGFLCTGRTSTRASKDIYYGIPKAFWHLHQRERNPFYGESRFYSCYATWYELWGKGGARDVRRTWFFKNAYDGGTMYYQPGSVRMPSGEVKHNKQLALELLATTRSGGYRVFPNVTDPVSGKPFWLFEPPKGNATPTGLLEYTNDLHKEELEGMGIPPEVVESQQSGGGMGSATGRKIPHMAFRSSLFQSADYLIYDFDKQILDGILYLRNGGKPVPRTIKRFRPKKAFTMDLGDDISNPGSVEATESDTNLAV